MLLVKESVLSFEEKTTQPWLNYLELLASTKHLLRLFPKKYYFGQFQYMIIRI